MRACRLALLALTGCVLWPLAARGYEVTKTGGGLELRWTALPMKFNIDGASVLPGITAADFQAAIRAAYQTWSSVSCAAFSSQDLGLVSLPWGNTDDFLNTHSVPPSWPPSYGQDALALAGTIYNPVTGKILDADVHYNAKKLWAVDGSSSAQDLQSTATHEIGHQLGLDHSSVTDAVMYYSQGAGVLMRSLTSDDVAGVCYLYPAGQPPRPECTEDGDCLASQVCTGGACVIRTTNGYGAPCQYLDDCQSGICLLQSSGGLCSQSCDATPCPYGDRCTPVSNATGYTKACEPGTGTGGTKKLGETCQLPNECSSKLCAPVAGHGTLCVQSCDMVKQDCPTGFACTSSSSGGLCTPAGPTTKKKLGEVCASSSDCESSLCAPDGAGPICLRPCTLGGPDTCPAGTRCAATSAGPAGCLSDSAGPGELGESCDGDGDCASGVCHDDGQGRVYCSQLCTAEIGCGGGFDCTAQGERSLCTARFGSTTGGGCSVSDPERLAVPTAVLALLGLGLAALVVARRARPRSRRRRAR